ncbi:MAG: ABC transporter ATP-binding protein/permease [Clostridia bacterium]|nr:ABC transporter ATP-binding protein/permease [Clostridia bacterium]
MLKLKNITKVYETASERVEALKDVSLCFRKSEFVSILGPSGCGKTTLLNIIGGLDHYTSGDLSISGRSTKGFRDRDWDVYRNHRVGFIFQSYNLIPHQTVLENVELALTIAGISRDQRRIRAKEALDRVGLKGKYYQRPNQLSGGQCQRVAIARALVNDPEILLADEPTGALDTQTSVQIMDLIREISKERLVIMVTHNPELAEEYSTRIIRLLDGRVTEDTNPFSEAGDRMESSLYRRFDRKKRRRGGKEKAKMSIFTAFRLSAKNLISKKGRTAMVGVAGSIGIIGIALVLALSAGIKGYIASMQDDMLSGNPIRISETAYDFEAMSDLMSSIDFDEIKQEDGKVFINSMLEYVAKMQDATDAVILKNEITETYIKYVTSMPASYYADMILGYDIDLSNNIYTEFLAEDGQSKKLSVSALTALYTSVLNKTEFSEYASFVSMLIPSFKQAPSNESYIGDQYDVLAGKVATGAGEIMLVLDSDRRVSDLLLARLGYYSQAQFINIVHEATESESYDAANRKEYFTYEELLGKTFTWHANDAIFLKNENPMTAALSPFTYDAFAKDAEDPDALELKVVGILQPKETISYGCMTSGIYYTEALTDHILEKNMDSAISTHLRESDSEAFQSMTLGAMKTGIYYDLTFTYEGTSYTDTVFVGQDASAALLMGGMSGMGGSSGGAGAGGGMGGMGGMGSGIQSLYVLSLRNLGGNGLANSVAIYPNNFETKDQVNAYLDAWNGEGDITVDGKVLASTDRSDVTYTDTLALVIAMINTMIDIISYALIAFTSISLVVSTVMIGIITYVSVVERIKEIGVIRSIGGRKKDVSRLFTAETVIIGLLSGLFGVGVTYGLSAIINLILAKVANIPAIAALPLRDAGIMIALSVFLTLVSGVFPARSAAKKDPVVALRTE